MCSRDNSRLNLVLPAAKEDGHVVNSGDLDDSIVLQQLHADVTTFEAQNTEQPHVSVCLNQDIPSTSNMSLVDKFDVVASNLEKAMKDISE